MSRTAKNKLTLESAGAGYRLFGYIGGQKVRRWSMSFAKLETLKVTLESQHQAEQKKIAEAMHAVQTPLTTDQVRDAEAAFRLLPTGRTLFECVHAAETILGTGRIVPC